MPPRRVRRLIPAGVWAEVAPLLPAERPKPQGGRPRVLDRAALAGIVYVLRVGSAWSSLPIRLGFGSGMTCWRRLREWQDAGVWPAVEQVLRNSLPGADTLPWERLRAGAPSGRRGRVALQPQTPERNETAITVAHPPRVSRAGGDAGMTPFSGHGLRTAVGGRAPLPPRLRQVV